jgi:hypothetical protein
LNGEPTVLNIGCADDPLGFGDGAMHFDLDDWSAVHKHFTQGDAHNLPFDDESYDVVILGDVLEHVLQPHIVLLEAARVTSRLLAVTVFEEWRLPGHGQFIVEGQQHSEYTSQLEGYKGRLDAQAKLHPNKVTVEDDENSHLSHINQFNDQDIHILIAMLNAESFVTLEAIKAFEIVYELDDHRIFNWLFCMERVRT